MIDWFAGFVGYDASHMRLGRFMEGDPEGGMVRDRDRWETARGSYESGVQVSRAPATAGMLASNLDHGFLCAASVIFFYVKAFKFI